MCNRKNVVCNWVLTNGKVQNLPVGFPLVAQDSRQVFDPQRLLPFLDNRGSPSTNGIFLSSVSDPRLWCRVWQRGCQDVFSGVEDVGRGVSNAFHFGCRQTFCPCLLLFYLVFRCRGRFSELIDVRIKLIVEPSRYLFFYLLRAAKSLSSEYLRRIPVVAHLSASILFRRPRCPYSGVPVLSENLASFSSVTNRQIPFHL